MSRAKVKAMAHGACMVLNKLAFKTYGLASVDYESIAAEASDIPKRFWHGYNVRFMWNTSTEKFNYRILNQPKISNDMDRVEMQDYLQNDTKCPNGDHRIRYVSTDWTNSHINKYCDHCKKWISFSFWPTIKVLERGLCD